MKKTFYVVHEDFRPDGDIPGELHCYEIQGETLVDALRQPIEDREEHPLPDGLKEMYRISVWV